MMHKPSSPPTSLARLGLAYIAVLFPIQGTTAPPLDTYKDVAPEIRSYVPHGWLALPLHPTPVLPPLATTVPARYRCVFLPFHFAATGLNDQGQVCGTYEPGASADSFTTVTARAALWAITAPRLRFLPAPATLLPKQPDNVMATKLNNNGVVVGRSGAQGSGAIFFSYFGAVAWEAGKKPRTFPGIPEHRYAEAVALNRWGDILVNAEPGSVMDSMRYHEEPSPPRWVPKLAFLWHKDKITPLGGLVAQGINDRGEIVVQDADNHARLLSGARQQDLGVAVPVDINNRTQVLLNDMRVFTLAETRIKAAARGTANGAVATAVTDNGDTLRSYLRVNNKRQRLPLLPHTTSSTATALNDRGQSIGDCDGNACLWQNGTVYDLNRRVTLPKGWHLDTAIAINNRGEILVSATRGGSETRFVLLSPVKK